MQLIQLQWIDYTILIAYVAFVIGIGWTLARYMKTSSDFLTSARSIPTWVTGLAFISANLGALELVGMAASGAKYGIATAHFYWVGAIPAMIFLAVFMMPFYYGSKARSVPEYLNMRFDGRVRCLNSIAFAVMTIFASGISMNALAKLLSQLLGWNYNWALWICSGVVLLYVLKGGLTSAIYTEVLQFFMIVLGFAPVVYLGMKDVGGWHHMTEKLQAVAQNPAALDLKAAGTHYAANAWTSAWQPLLAGSSNNPMGVDIFAMVFGLGFVLSFGYWCTNFLVVQRAMAAKNMTAARNTPLVAAVPKMLFPFLVIVPGMIAVALTAMPDKNYRIPPPVISQAAYTKAVDVVKNAGASSPDSVVTAVNTALGKKVNAAKIGALLTENAGGKLSDAELEKGVYNAVAEYDYDGVILSLVKKYCPPGLLGLALTALLASFMSGMAGNVTAFNTVWTYDLYQAYLMPGKSDSHYFWTGKLTTVAGILLSIGAAYFASLYANAMDVIQLVFSFVNAPLFATFLLGMFWARTTGTGAFIGLFGGIGASAIVHGLTVAEGKGGWLGQKLFEFPSTMAQNFWLAAIAFIVCFTLTLVISLLTQRTKSDVDLKGLVYSLTPKIKADNLPFFQRPGVIGVILLICCVIMNLIFW
ncbi:MAG: sodium:solute symporter family protein [Verrucomicrobiae bacterium]|nr:sodium:solute symporter family protein [Verrucomicrobiae bacterium]